MKVDGKHFRSIGRRRRLSVSAIDQRRLADEFVFARLNQLH